MHLSAGMRIGPYDVLEPLGEGGMGQVWKARDARLLRDVAIKVLPEAFADDPERLARFERECQMLASLNHPNIATIHGIEETSSGRALVMELVAGPTLADRIGAGPIAVHDALAMARDVADALEAAHERGIIHRDLKPANLKQSDDGRVKVLDFGLAKSNGAGRPSGVTESPTIASFSMAGTLVGTAGYMSPEQARGAAVDRRTDIWAFGCVLYELLTGRRTFEGHTFADVLAASVRAEPDMAALPADVPASIGRLIERCLVKDPRQRLRDIGDARLAIEDALAGRDAGGAATDRPARPGWRLHAWWLLVAAITTGLGSWVALHVRDARAPEVRKLEVTLPDPLMDTWTRPRLSPDGQAIAFGTTDHLWIRRMDRVEPLEVPGSERAEAPFWSWDGQHLAFAAQRKLWRIRIDGGGPTAVCDLPPSADGRIIAGVWRPDDVIVFSGWHDAIYEVPAAGGDPRVLLRPAAYEVDFHELALLPDGKTLLMLPHEVTGQPLPRIEALRAGRRIVIVRDQPRTTFEFPRYAPSGHLLYERLGTNIGIWALPFSPDTLTVTGDAFRIAPDGRMPQVARDGTLVYVLGTTPYQLAWVDRKGARLSSLGPPLWDVGAPAISPDEKHVAVPMSDRPNTPADRHIWIIETATGRLTPLYAPTTRTGDAVPSWSPDGTSVIFVQAARDQPTLVWCRAALCGAPRDLLPGNGRVTFSPAGVFVFARSGKAGLDLWQATATKDLSNVKAEPLIAGPASTAGPRLSPDGRFLAYHSDETGQPVVYLRRFPLTDERWTVSLGGGLNPFWNGAGTELFYRRLDGGLVAVPVALGRPVTLGEPQLLFGGGDTSRHTGPGLDTSIGGGTTRDGRTGLDVSMGWSVTRDGQRFLIVARPEGAKNLRLIVVQDWLSEFRKTADSRPKTE